MAIRWLPVWLTILCAPTLNAQASSAERAPISGTLTYNHLVLPAPPSSTAHPWTRRFAGRLAGPVARRSYVGLMVGSWVRLDDACSTHRCDDGLLRAYAEAVNHQLYAQQYLARGWFVRAGSGVAKTTVLVPNGLVLDAYHRTRWSWSLGTGYDQPLRRLLWFTPSIDYAWLPALRPSSDEIRWALALGLGVTLR